MAESDNILTKLHDLLLYLIPQLKEANLQLEVARHLVRLAHAMELFSNHTYGVLAEKMDEVGRMIGGWLKSVSGVRAAPGAPA